MKNINLYKNYKMIVLYLDCLNLMMQIYKKYKTNLKKKSQVGSFSKN